MLKRNIIPKVIWLLVLLFWTTPGFGQDTLWSRTYGSNTYDYAYSIQQTTDGGYIMVGTTVPFAGTGDVYLIKTNSSGDTLWIRTYGGNDWDGGFSVQQTTDGGYIVVGYTDSFGSDRVYLIKTDSHGDTLWTHTYPGTEGRCVRQTKDVGYIVAGSRGPDAYLIKTDSSGVVVWGLIYGGSFEDVAISVQQTIDGGYVVAGATQSFGAGGSSIYLFKTDSLGNPLWSRVYGGAGDDVGSSVQQTTDRGFIVVGSTNSFGAGESDVYLIKTDSLGDTLWNRTYGSSSGDMGWSVQQTTDGGYIVGGYTESFGAEGSHIYLIKANSLGDTLWSGVYGGIASDESSVQQTADGGYIVAGYADPLATGDMDVMLTKLDSLGNACIGEFVTSTVMSVSSTVESPTSLATSLATRATSPPTIVTSPPTEVTTVCMRVCGDVNGDGVIDLEDVLFLIGYLYKGGLAPDPLEAGDVDCSGEIELGDMLYLLNYLYKNGLPPCC